MRRAGLPLVASLAVTLGGCAGTIVPPAEQLAVARVQHWFDGLTGLTARFVQVGPGKAIAEGALAFRPDGSLRLDYAPGDRNVLVARGGHIVDVDRTSGAVTTMNARATPLGLLLDGPVRLEGDGIAVTDVAETPGRLQVSLAETRNRGAGLLTLVFDAPAPTKPLSLVSIETVDGERRRTVFHFEDVRLGPVPPATFGTPTV